MGNVFKIDTAQKMKFFVKDFFSECDQIRRKLQIWSHLLKKSFMVNFIFLCIDSMSRSSHLNYQYGAIYVILINNQIIQIINKVLSMKKPNKCNAET